VAALAQLTQTGSMDGPRLSVEEQIRAAQAGGAFDNLPGAGKPLKLDDVNDPNWWVKSLMRRENIDASVLVHPTIALRREADTFPESLTDLPSEDQVRAVLEDFNERVKGEWRRPAVGPTFPVVARQVAVEPMVDRWREMRERLVAEATAAAMAAVPLVEAPTSRKRRWRWRRAASI
jgi:hypothetical protein